MLTALFLALATHAISEAGSTTLNGRCDYPATLPVPAPGELRIFCDAVTITKGDSPDDRLVSFSRSHSGDTFGFAGKATADKIMVRNMYLRQNVATAATGACRIFRRNANISAISCIARIGARTYVANFKSSARS